MASNERVTERDGAGAEAPGADVSPGASRSRFYQSVAETLALLHAAPGGDLHQTIAQVADILSSTMALPLVWIGRRAPERDTVTVLAAGGPAAGYTEALHVGCGETDDHGKGPVGVALRTRLPQTMTVESPAFAPWRPAAHRWGLAACVAAAVDTRDGGQLVLAAYTASAGADPGNDLPAWAQRLAGELARFWDHHALLERNQRMARYRDAQSAIQRALLDQPDPDAVYRTLARSLVDIAGAAAVDVHVTDADGASLRRVALTGPIADTLTRLSPNVRADGDGPSAPLQTLLRGTMQIRVRPREHPDMSPLWQREPLVQMGALGCWPIFAAGDRQGATRTPLGVFAIVTREEDAFDDEMCRLLDELADAAGLALRQHERRRALLEEQQRQTYLALHDALTGLPNRRALDMHLECAFERAERSGRLVAVGMLDLDDLKPINDRYGHAMGDRLLIEVSMRLQRALRLEDYVARLGGDEFVIVCEGLRSESELEPLLEQLWRVLREPLRLDGETFELTASLGIALFPEHAKGSGEQLLRRADQAMYQVKARKRQRERWWSMPLLSGELPSNAEYDGLGLRPYGEVAAGLLQSWSAAAAPKIPALADAFVDELRAHDGIARLLAILPPADLARLAQRIAQYLRMLFTPALEIGAHRARAGRIGRFHAASGVEEVWMLEAIERLRDLLAGKLGELSRGDRRPLGIVLQRLGLERQWQLESMRALQRERVSLLSRLNTLAWSADGYLELIQAVVDALASHEEIISCSVGRPEPSGQLTYEAVGGEAFANYLRALARGEAAPIRVDAESPEGAGPSGRAWRSGTVQRCLHYGSDPAALTWREQALSIGVVSNLAIPLCPMPPTPSAILTIYSPYPGALQSEDQQAFVEQLKHLLDLALARLAPPRLGTELLPFFVRERWRARVATPSLQVHYQPVVRLSDGRVTELEALARLADDDGALLAPGRFLPALGDDDLVTLFRQVLSRAALQRAALERAGHRLDMSVNAPAAALEDRRYAEAAAAVLRQGDCPAEALLFEILESPLGSEHTSASAMAGMHAFKALGVRLVEDDLGAGYSSLIRLRQWPFDRVKIDQAIVMQVADDPLRTLRFIRQLIRLGHDLDLEVVVEGLESPGLIEAALALGADMGQGYALARPMPAEALPAWLRDFAWRWDIEHPATALGALAAALLWEEQLQALPADAAYWRQHAEAVCGSGAYLGCTSGLDAELVEAHAAMHAAAASGPHDPAYRQRRERFLALLIEQARCEESGRHASS